MDRRRERCLGNSLFVRMLSHLEFVLCILAFGVYNRYFFHALMSDLASIH